MPTYPLANPSRMPVLPTLLTLARHAGPVKDTDMVPTNAVCGCADWRVACPRHSPKTYAEAYARHATDSIGPF